MLRCCEGLKQSELRVNGCKILILVGKSGSGKTNLRQLLIDVPNVNVIKTDTTRNKGWAVDNFEVYNILSEDDFSKKYEGKGLSAVNPDGHWTTDYCGARYGCDVSLFDKDKINVVVLDAKCVYSIRDFVIPHLENGYIGVLYLDKADSEIETNLCRRFIGNYDTKTIREHIEERRLNDVSDYARFDLVGKKELATVISNGLVVVDVGWYTSLYGTVTSENVGAIVGYFFN